MHFPCGPMKLPKVLHYALKPKKKNQSKYWITPTKKYMSGSYIPDMFKTPGTQHQIR